MARRKLHKEIFTSEVSAIHQMKIAVALTCLRSKPAGMTGQQYARQLCDQFQTSQLRWKQKLEQTERELLHLRQQLVISQHQQPSQTAEISDSSWSSSQPLFPTPPPSGNPGTLDCEPTEHQDVSASLSQHSRFLHHVLTLQTGSTLISDKNMGSLVHLSLLHSIDLLAELHDGNDYIWRMQTQCVECLDKLLKHVSTEFRTGLIQKTASVSGEIIHRLASDKTLNPKIRQQQSGLIKHLGNNSSTIGPILEHLTTEIGRFSDHLRESVTNSLDPVYYNNMYLVIDTLDNCLCSPSLLDLEVNKRENLISKLESSVMYLSERFPLFTLAVWRLCCKLSV